MQKHRSILVGARVRGLAVHEELPDRVIPFSRYAEPLVPGPSLNHGHLVLRQRTRFVGANHRGASERFHGGEFPDQGVVLDHPLHPQR